MRTFPIMLVALAAVPAPASAAVRNFTVTGFEQVRVEGPYTVRLTNGVAPFARATGDRSALDRISIEMHGTTVVVRASLSAWGGDSGASTGPVVIDLGTHELSAAWLTGSGSLAVNRASGLKFDLSVQGSGSADIGSVAVDQMNLNLGGTASARLSGKVGKLTASARGTTTLEGAELTVKDATINVDGAATITADVHNSASVNGTGPATVTLTGDPACTVRLSGSASVNGCRISR